MLLFGNDYRISYWAAVAPEVNMELVGHFGGTTDAVDVADNYAYVGQGQDLLILDITNPSSPVSVGKIMTKGFVRDIKISGNYAYVADWDQGLVIVDISNPLLQFSKEVTILQDMLLAFQFPVVMPM